MAVYLQPHSKVSIAILQNVANCHINRSCRMRHWLIHNCKVFDNQYLCQSDKNTIGNALVMNFLEIYIATSQIYAGSRFVALMPYALIFKCFATMRKSTKCAL